MELFTAKALGKMRTTSGIEHDDVRFLDITARILAANAAKAVVAVKQAKNIHLAIQCMRRIHRLPRCNYELNQRLSGAAGGWGDEDQQVEWNNPPTCSPAATKRL